MSISAILYLAALITFILVTFGVTADEVNLLGLGLALVAGGLLVGGTVDRRVG